MTPALIFGILIRTNFQYNKGIWGSPFVGLQNFKFLFMSGQLSLLLRNTVLYNLAFIVVGNILQLSFAILLNEVQSKIDAVYGG